MWFSYRMTENNDLYYRREVASSASPVVPGFFTAAAFRLEGSVFFYIATNVGKRSAMVHLAFRAQSHARAIAMLKRLYPGSGLGADIRTEKEVRKFFVDYVQGRRLDLSYPVWPLFLQSGTDFQRRVWEKISRISYGETRSYGQVARELGNANLARAVGQACNANPLALVIPCHRVVGTRGPGGFAGGPVLKSRLLGVEQKFSGQAVS